MAEEDDQELVALIDNELDESRRADLLSRLETDVVLRRRYEALMEAKAPIGAALQTLLEHAPVARLRAAIPPESAASRGARPPAGLAWRQLAAGFVIGLLAAAAAAWLAFGLPRGDQGDWRTAVLAYMRLYTDETFAFPSPDRQTQAAQLSAVGRRVGAALTPETVTLPGLEFKVAFILSYEGSPLGEIAYTDSTGAPVLFCIIANGGEGTPAGSERRDAFSLASWSRPGHGYLVIGGLPEQRIADLGRTLEARF